MEILKRAGVLAFNGLLLFLILALHARHHQAWRTAPEWGGADPGIRAAVLAQLATFQDGYAKRDPAGLSAFMERLVSRDHPVALGTMPGEIRVGYDDIARLIRDDWESWGDCRFRLDETHLSHAGDTAWFATAGSVTFYLSRFLVLPLRLSGVMVKEDGAWKLRQVQFQFDLDLSTLLVLEAVLLIWLGINAAWLAVIMGRRLFSRRSVES
jgi:hypothetical protein